MVEISTYDDATTSKDHLCLIESIEDEEGDPTGNNKLAQGNHSKVVKNDEPSKVSNVFNVIRRSLRTVRGKRTTNVARSSKYIYKNEDSGKVDYEIKDNQKLRSIEELRNLVSSRQHSQIKKFIRSNGWPSNHEARNVLWPLLCHYKDFDSSKVLYTTQLEEITHQGVQDFHVSFLGNHDSTVLLDFGLNQIKMLELQSLLIVIEYLKPDIRYATILYPLCSIFLLYLDPDDAYACINFLTMQGNRYLLQSEVAIFASFHTLSWLLRKHKKKVFKCLKNFVGASTNAEMADLFKYLYQWIFRLPFPYLVRVLDCFIVEGHKIMFRVAISILYLWHKHIYTRKRFSIDLILGNKATFDIEKVSELNSQICAMAANPPVAIEALLDVAFSIRNLSNSTIHQRQKHYEDKYRPDVIRRKSERKDEEPIRILFTRVYESRVTNREVGRDLMLALPRRYQLETPKLLFRLSEDGASFVNLWERVERAEQTLLLIRTSSDEVIGAYLSNSWYDRRNSADRSTTKFFGTGESYVFKLQNGRPIIYKWIVQKDDSSASNTPPQMFMTAGERFLIVGSGRGGDAISIRDELTRGQSYPSETYCSPALTNKTDFIINELEVYSVVPG